MYSFTFQGKKYAVVQELKTWREAGTCAATLNYDLVHINDSAEQQAVVNAIVNGAMIANNYTVVPDGGGIAYLWIGASDMAQEGTWRWDGNSDSAGVIFWTGQGNAGSGNGQAVSNSYHNWGGATRANGPDEPDNFQGQQHAAGLALRAWPFGKAYEWNDIRASNRLYFVLEHVSTLGKAEQAATAAPLSLYPNPSAQGGRVTVHNPRQKQLESASLFSLSGKLLWQQSLQASAVDIPLDLSHVPVGSYLLRLRTAEDGLHFLKLTLR